MKPLQFGSFAIGAVVLCVISGSSAGFAASNPAVQPLAFDHVWIHVMPGAPEARVLEEAGLQLGPMTKVHTGMGTASRFFFFHDTCLELIWVEDADALRRAAPEFARTLLGGAEASPFGIGLRRVSTETDALPFETMPISAEWIRSEHSIQVARSASEKNPAPSIFVVPRYMAVADRQAEFAKYSIHRLGVNRITGLRVRGRALPSGSPAVRALITQKIVEFALGEKHLLELELDGAVKGRVVDARPALPLIIRY